MARDDDDRTLSWREIDRLRDHPDELRELREQRRSRGGRRRHGYQSYKDALNRAFDSGALAGLIGERLGEDAPGPGAATGRAALVAKIRKAGTPGERHRALDELLAAGEGLPDDVELLAGLVEHPDEDVVRQVLLHIEELLPEQPLKRKAGFLMRLETISLTATDPDTVEVAERLVDRLR